MKTRIVLTFDEMEFARLAGAASARNLSVKDFIKKELAETTAPKRPLQSFVEDGWTRHA